VSGEAVSFISAVSSEESGLEPGDISDRARIVSPELC
jgi:hypothetical protein